MNTVEKIKKLCAERNIPISKLEKDCVFANGYIARLKKGTLPSDRLVKVANYFDVPVESLYPDSAPKPTKQIISVYHTPRKEFADVFAGDKPLRISRRIPVLGRVAAGIPIEAIEDILDWEELSGEIALTGEFFGLRIKGDSMEPSICNGDTVIVRQQDDAEDGDIVIALVNGNDAVCKCLKKYKSGLALVSKNSSYDPMYFTETEIDETPVRIIGKVIELRRRTF